MAYALCPSQTFYAFPKEQKLLPMFFSRNCVVLGFTFWSLNHFFPTLIHFELFFFNMVQDRGIVAFFSCECTYLSALYFKRLICSIDCLCFFTSWPYAGGSISGLQILFHCSVCLSFYQYSLVTIALE